MKWIISVAAMVAVMSFVQAGPPPVTEACVPNASWKDDCNDCICNEQAQRMCTTRDCTTTTTTAPTANPAPHRDCEPGTTWKQDCNRCHCGSTGVGICTQMACLGDLGLGLGDLGQEQRSAVEVPKPGRPGMGALCREGLSWKQDCNRCTCMGGRAACTMMACPATGTAKDSSDSSESSEESGYKCTPGTSWDKECNKCRCTSNGLAVCTLKKCVAKRAVPEQPEGCKPGDVWQVECNRCRCTASGIPACTKMRCLPQQPQPQQ